LGCLADHPLPKAPDLVTPRCASSSFLQTRPRQGRRLVNKRTRIDRGGIPSATLHSQTKMWQQLSGTPNWEDVSLSCPNPATKWPPCINFLGPSVPDRLSCTLPSPRFRWYFGHSTPSRLDLCAAYPKRNPTSRRLAGPEEPHEGHEAGSCSGVSPPLAPVAMPVAPFTPPPHLSAPDQRC
jgi:hypothetical protein